MGFNFRTLITESMQRLRFRHSGARIGIAALLGVAFLAVAALALTANMIAERGSVIVDSLQERTTFTPAPTKSIAIFALAQQVDTRAKSAGDALELSVDRYERSLRNRAEGTTGEGAEALTASEFALDHSVRDITAQKWVSAAAQRRITAYHNRFSAAGEELIALSDTRGALQADYRDCLESMQARARSAVDSGWKIFGHVFARRSLIAVSGALDALSQQSARMFDREQSDAGDTLMQAAETRVLTALDSRDLKSQGDAWRNLMREDLERLVNLRLSMRSLDERRRTTQTDFESAAADLKKLVRDLCQFTAASTPAAPHVPPSGQSSLQSLVPRTITTRVPAPAERIPSTLVPWISAGVLGLVITISIAAVWSIVVPVRRMLHATREIARGNLTSRLVPGGIKELHGLALAFNDMAEQLQRAQHANIDYQQQLELRVEERTRQLRELALNDPLTALPNRRHLQTILESAIDDARSRGHLVAIYFLDIDNFKNINDSMGHTFGDRLLEAMARRLESVGNQAAVAARLGGDEFTVIYPQISDMQTVESAGWALVRAFESPLNVEARDVAVSVSVGASVFPLHGREPDALLQAADTALFQAKGAGRRQLAIFSPALFEVASKKFSTEQGLRRALERDEFELWYQPEFDTRTFEISVVEALLRWRQPAGRLAPPGEFLSVAEECGLITELNDWVLRHAIEDACRWRQGPWRQSRVAINLSSRQLIDSNFVERIASLLREHGLPPSAIEIELTESVLQTGPATVDALKQVRALGVTIALDDFGTGYSSLASLEQLPLTRIKLDRSLIESIDTSPRACAIARTIIALCRSLDLEVTAEGIERSEQLALLRTEGHLHVQGYFLAPPLHQSELLRALSELPAKYRGPHTKALHAHDVASATIQLR